MSEIFHYAGSREATRRENYGHSTKAHKTDAKLRHRCAATRITRHDAIVGLVTDVARVVGRPFALSERGPPANLATRIAPHEGLSSQPELKERPTFAIWLALTS